MILEMHNECNAHFVYKVGGPEDLCTHLSDNSPRISRVAKHGHAEVSDLRIPWTGGGRGGGVIPRCCSRL